MKHLLSFMLSVSLFFLPSHNITSNTVTNCTNKEKVVYLTFDDAPGGKVTEDMLNTLKKNNVNATFFLIGDQIDNNQQNIVQQIVKEGNAVGLHSYTHKHSKLYGPNSNFFKEMEDCQTAIEKACGVKTYIMRFPFGTCNKYFKLSKSMVNQVHEHNLKIYEWNVDSTDGLHPTMSSKEIAKRAKSDKDVVFVLMHSGYVNKNSAKALQEVINYYKENGYTFKTITTETKELYKIIKNN